MNSNDAHTVAAGVRVVFLLPVTRRSERAAVGGGRGGADGAHGDAGRRVRCCRLEAAQNITIRAKHDSSKSDLDCWLLHIFQTTKPMTARPTTMQTTTTRILSALKDEFHAHGLLLWLVEDDGNV